MCCFSSGRSRATDLVTPSLSLNFAHNFLPSTAGVSLSRALSTPYDVPLVSSGSHLDYDGFDITLPAADIRCSGWSRFGHLPLWRFINHYLDSSDCLIQKNLGQLGLYQLSVRHGRPLCLLIPAQQNRKQRKLWHHVDGQYIVLLDSPDAVSGVSSFVPRTPRSRYVCVSWSNLSSKSFQCLFLSSQLGESQNGRISYEFTDGYTCTWSHFKYS